MNRRKALLGVISFTLFLHSLLLAEEEIGVTCKTWHQLDTVLGKQAKEHKQSDHWISLTKNMWASGYLSATYNTRDMLSAIQDLLKAPPQFPEIAMNGIWPKGQRPKDLVAALDRYCTKTSNRDTPLRKAIIDIVNERK
jgi:hypothetical protein